MEPSGMQLPGALQSSWGTEFHKTGDRPTSAGGRSSATASAQGQQLLSSLNALREEHMQHAKEFQKWQKDLDTSLSQRHAQQEEMLKNFFDRLEAQQSSIRETSVLGSAPPVSKESTGLAAISEKRKDRPSKRPSKQTSFNFDSSEELSARAGKPRPELPALVEERPSIVMDESESSNNGKNDAAWQDDTAPRCSIYSTVTTDQSPSPRNAQGWKKSLASASATSISQNGSHGESPRESKKVSTPTSSSDTSTIRSTRNTISPGFSKRTQSSLWASSARKTITNLAPRFTVLQGWMGRNANQKDSINSFSTESGTTAGNGEHRAKFKAQFCDESFQASVGFSISARYDSSERGIPAIIHSTYFDAMVASVIFLNTIAIGAQTDWKARYLRESSPKWWIILEWLFCAFFVMEILLRIVGEGKEFVRGANKRWNLFDVVVVSFQLVELTVSTPELSENRALRVIRIIRVLRIIRVMRFLHDLRKMIVGIASTIGSLFWAMVLLIMVMFLYGVIMTENTTEIRQREGYEGNLGDNYGSLTLTLYSLFKAISGGTDWGELADPLKEDGHWVYVFLFSLYVAFAVFCVLNIVTAVFVDHANSICQDEALRSHRKLISELRSIFMFADKDGDGMLDFTEFQICIGLPQVQHKLRRLDLDVETVGVKQLFDLVDLENSGEIDIETFTRGVMRLKGRARSFDIFRIQGELSQILDKIDGVQKAIDKSESLGNFEKQMSRLRQTATYGEQSTNNSMPQSSQLQSSFSERITKDFVPLSQMQDAGKMTTVPVQPPSGAISMPPLPDGQPNELQSTVSN